MDRRAFLKSILFLPFTGLAEPVRTSAADTERIVLLDTVVAGFQYHRGERVWRTLSIGDPLQLIREPGNAYDSRAVEVFRGRDKLGYIPRADNSAIAQLLDRGTALSARITGLKKSPDPWERVAIRIELA